MPVVHSVLFLRHNTRNTAISKTHEDDSCVFDWNRSQAGRRGCAARSVSSLVVAPVDGTFPGLVLDRCLTDDLGLARAEREGGVGVGGLPAGGTGGHVGPSLSASTKKHVAAVIAAAHLSVLAQVTACAGAHGGRAAGQQSQEQENEILHHTSPFRTFSRAF